MLICVGFGCTRGCSFILVFNTEPTSFASFTELDSAEGSLIRDGEELLCPFCYGQSFELEALIKHVDDEHAYQQRSTVRGSCVEANEMTCILSC